MPQYYGSTDPQSSTNAPAQTYSNFNGVNTPVLKSTGSAALQSVAVTSALTAQSITGSSAVTGYLEQLGTTTPLIATTDISLATAVPARGFSVLTVASSSNPYFQLAAPKLGAQVELYAVVTATSHAKTILTSTDGSITVGSTCNAIVMGGSSDFVCLRGMSTIAWKLMAIGGVASITTA